MNFPDHKKFYWIVLFRVSHASDISSEHHMNQLRPVGVGGVVNAQVLIQWIWSGALSVCIFIRIPADSDVTGLRMTL